VVDITVSRRQAELASEVCRGLPVEIRLQDYRDLDLRCDRILSLGMFEHVGYKNYRTFMEVVHRCLADDGLFLLHTIGGAGEGLFVLEDWHNLGPDYDRTLRQWHRNFQSNWATLKRNYDEHFYRTWEYYLLSCAGSFRARENQVWQIVFSPRGVMGGFRNRI
jgi:cyclopropane-fatty-acyl-phospholipid synthase